MTVNYSFSNRDGGEKDKKNRQGERNGGRPDDLFGSNTDFSDRRESQFKENEETTDSSPSDFFNSKLLFDLTFAHSLTYGNNNRENKIIGNSLMASANIDLSTRWKMGVSTGYDFVQNGITFTQFRFERDLLSWRMDFNWSPYGANAFWGFFIGIKSSVLSDIKYDRRSLPDRQFR